jgi:hypothetical protein
LSGLGTIAKPNTLNLYSGIVEESLQIDVNLLVREGTIRRQSQTSGEISWTRFGSTTSSMGYEAVCEIDTVLISGIN